MNLRNKLVLAIALVSSSCAYAEIQPQAVDMGAFKFVPTLNISHSYDDNIFFQPNAEKSSGITRLKPQLQLLAEDGESTYSATYRADVGRYSSSSDDDYQDHGLALDAFLDLGVRNDLTLAASVDRKHDSRGTGSSEGNNALAITEPDEYVLTGVSGEWDFGAEGATFGASFTAAYSDIDYKNNKTETQFRNRDEKKVGLRLYGRLQPKTRFFVEYETTDITYDEDPLPRPVPNSNPTIFEPGLQLDSKQNTYSLGVVWDISGKTTGTVKIGQTDKNFDDGRQADGDLNSWSAEVAWSPRTYSTVLLEATRAPQETNGTGSFIDNRTTQVTWNHDWSSLLHSSVSLSTGKDRYEGSVRSDDINSYSFGVNYDIDRWVNVGLSYTHDDKDSSDPIFDYTRKLVALTLDLSL